MLQYICTVCLRRRVCTERTYMQHAADYVICAITIAKLCQNNDNESNEKSTTVGVVTRLAGR